MKHKRILITGASSGIGRASALRFAELGCSLVLVARRKGRLEELASLLSSQYGCQAHVFGVDVTDRDQVRQFVQELSAKGLDIDVLVNNAGLARGLNKIQDGLFEHWDAMIDTNVKGLLNVTRFLLPSMIERNSGHIVNIGSIAGHEHYPMGNVYLATKHAVRALTKSLRLDLGGTSIRVSEVAPGAVETEFSEVRFDQDKQKAKDVYKGFQPLVAEDIADAVVYCATRPPHVNIAEMVVYPQAQAGTTIFRA